MTDITSLQNPRIKYIVKLRESKKQRQQDRLMLVEGRDEINLALAGGYQPQTILACPELTIQQIDRASAEVLSLSRAVFQKISVRENPDGWLGIFPIPEVSLIDLKLSPLPLLVVAESIEKPGNLGAILRTADAAGVDALLVCDPRVDLYNPNVVRASRGALFSVLTVETSNADALAFLRGNGITVLAAAPRADIEYTRQNLCRPVAIVVGTEDEGLSGFWLDHADAKVRIPMSGKINSLNVSIAAALIAYEALRQRGEGPNLTHHS